MMIPSAAFEIAPGRRTRDLYEELQVVLESWELGSRLIGLSQCERVFVWRYGRMVVIAASSLTMFT
jgi:hypothetical protein